MEHWAYDEAPAPLGLVPVEGRGSLPFALVHGESLLAAASWALTTAGVRLYDLSVPFEQVRERCREEDVDLVVHDPLCPLTPVEFLVEALELARSTRAVVLGVRPVTDTVKEYDAQPDGSVRLGATVDREGLASLASPVVLPGTVVAALEDLPTDDLGRLVLDLAARFPVRQLPAPALARRVVDAEDLQVLAALSSSRD